MNMGGGYYPATSKNCDRWRGARIAITKGLQWDDPASDGPLHHETAVDRKAVLFRSYPEGVRVGCTFIETEALRHIWEKHQYYLNHRKDSLEHQSGVD